MICMVHHEDLISLNIRHLDTVLFDRSNINQSLENKFKDMKNV